MLNIDLNRYAEDRSCVTHEGLKAKLLEDLLPAVAGMKLQLNRCLIATYVKPKISSGGILFTDRTTEEDRWQGKVGLLLATGPTAFRTDDVMARADVLAAEGADDYEHAVELAFAGFGIPQIGDWVAFRTSETHEIGVRVAAGIGASCRQIFDDSIVMVLNDPTLIW